MKLDIPTHWIAPKFEDLIEYAIGGDWGKDPAHDDEDFVEVFCIRGSEFREWNRDRGSTASLRKIKANSLLNRELREGDILVEISGGGPEQPVGRTVLIDRVALAKNVHLPKVCTNFLRLVRICEPLNSEYSNAFLGFFYKSGEITKYQGGSNNLRNLKFPDYISIEIPLPPLNEQRRIVAKIEELFSEIDAGVASLKTARAQLGVYRQSLLKQAFEGKLTEQWRTQNPDKLEPAEQLLARIRSEREARYQQQLTDWQTAVEEWEAGGKEGRKPSKPKKPDSVSRVSSDDLKMLPSLDCSWIWLNVDGVLKAGLSNGRSVKDRSGGFPVLRLTALREGRIDLREFKEGDWDRDEGMRFCVQLGDFLISRGNGSIRLVGRGGVVRSEAEVAFPDTMIRLPLDTAIVDPTWFSFLWNSAGFRRQIESSARTTAGIYKINQGAVNGYKVPLCSLPEQQEIIRILEEQFTAIEQNEAEIDAALQRAEALRQSILKKAFAGKLVPQDPNDEPASVLLERIRAEREAAELAKKAKPRAVKKKAKTNMKSLIEIFNEQTGWISASKVFELKGVRDGNQTDVIEKVYEELRLCIDVVDVERRGDEDWFFLKTKNVKGESDAS